MRHMECEFIDKTDHKSDINHPLFYETSNSSKYKFYEFNNKKGEHALVQYCQLIGKNKDAIQCLNGWASCPHYKHKRLGKDTFPLDK